MSNESKGSSVFISYSASDNKFAHALYEHLRSMDIEVFLDFELSAGSSFQEVLRDAIVRVDVVIPVMSPAYFASHWCQAELSLAFDAGKRLLPVLLDGRPQGPLSYLQYLDAQEEPGDELPTQIADLVRGSHG